MTQQEIDRITIKMLEQPDLLTDEEVAAIVADGELRELYEAAVLAKRAGAAGAEIDADAEWLDFCSKHRLMERPAPIVNYRRRYLRIAAAVIAGVALATSAILMILKSNNGDTSLGDGLMAKVDTLLTLPKVDDEFNTVEISIVDTLRDTIVGKKRPKTVRPKVSPTPKRYLASASKYSTETKAKSAVDEPAAEVAAQPEPMDPELALQIARQQARIDNQIATARAEQYRTTYNTMRRTYGREPGPQPVMMNIPESTPSQGNFMRVVMQ